MVLLLFSFWFVFFFSFKENISGQRESRREPVNVAVEERASLGNTSSGSSSTEPEDPGKKRDNMFLEMTETTTLSLTFIERRSQ